jgi:uncharacterized protein (TIGR00106 family)
MAIAEVTVVPVGTGNASVSEFVVDIIKLAKSTGLKLEITSMGTNIEGPLEDILAVAQAMQQRCLATGAQRVFTSIKIDDRSDLPVTIEGKRARIIEGLKRR